MNKITIAQKNLNLFCLHLFFSIFITIFIRLAFSDLQIVTQKHIWFLSFIINFYTVFSLYILKKFNYNKLPLVSLVVIFFFLFNFGQSFMWSFGIHGIGEIGTSKLFSNFSVPRLDQILRTLLFSAYCYFSFCVGVISIECFTIEPKITISKNNELYKKIIYNLSLFLGIFIIPLTFFKIFLILSHAVKFGYVSLYYSDFKLNPLLLRGEDYFFPVVVGLLIGSGYKKVNQVYFIFALYTILYLLAGERGNWLYKLVVLIWMHHRYYLKLNWKKILKGSFFAFLFLYLIGVAVDVRNIGISNIELSDIQRSFTSGNILFRYIFEMGNSLGVTLIILSIGREPFQQFGNTFVFSLLTSISTKIALFFGVKYTYLANFLSQEILKISWGTGFNLFSEAYINAGWLGFLYLFIFGIFVSIMLKTNSNVKRVFLATISCSIICSMIRDSSLSGFRQFVQVVLFLNLIIGFLYYFKKRNIN